METVTTFDIVCLIHGDEYDWQYVEKLHSMIERNFSFPFRFHVFTEPHRSVPDNMIRHDLIDWPGVSGRRKAWWYKMQMFNPAHGIAQILYFDLDVVITGSLDWIASCRREHFWALKDFKYIWRPAWTGINSSVMYWDVNRFQHVWAMFEQRDINTLMRQYPGDQDFLSDVVDLQQTRYFDLDLIQSWRWQVFDGGMDMKSRTWYQPNAGAIINEKTRIIIFHGKPKPHQIEDPKIIKHWQ